ncbi:hypothetical protein ElyMa_002553300 [Elysia marginata]|uniref:LysM domain-containing protein n=1 Tax=Elysia marginata TaxID=1093978 RepID=A0AAV4GYZ1_9GAST|nr:hypothetical protein ElyMa_002553300 [Elysia marginata]
MLLLLYFVLLFLYFVLLFIYFVLLFLYFVLLFLSFVLLFLYVVLLFLYCVLHYLLCAALPVRCTALPVLCAALPVLCTALPVLAQQQRLSQIVAVHPKTLTMSNVRYNGLIDAAVSTLTEGDTYKKMLEDLNPGTLLNQWGVQLPVIGKTCLRGKMS